MSVINESIPLSINELHDKGLWFITDLHLSDRELSTTKGMVDNSIIILDEIYNNLINNPNIKVIVLSGDIQHRTPTKREYMTEWTYKFMQIRDILKERIKELNIQVYNNKNENITDSCSPLFSLKGNHDYDKHIKFTYYDELIKLGIITQPTKIIWDNTQYNLLSYGELNKLEDDIYNKDNSVDNKILLSHDYIYDESAPEWASDLAEKGHAFHYDMLKELDYDVVLIGHIHEQEKIKQLDFGTKLWQVGCPARTSYTSNSERNEGYTSVINNDKLELHALNLSLMDYNDYFKIVVTNAKRERKNNLAEFSLNLDNANLTYDSYENSIDNVEGIDISIKEKAKEYIRKVGE